MPPPDPRQSDRTARLAALTNAHANGGSVAGSSRSQQSPIHLQAPSYPNPYPQPPSIIPPSRNQSYNSSPQPPPSSSRAPAAARSPAARPGKEYMTAAEEKRQLEAELVSEAVCASLRAVDPEEWRAKAEASWRAQATSVPTPAKVRKGERLELEAQELSAMAEEWRLRAEEAWERHLLEGDDDTMREMKDAQRRAKKYEAKMMDKLALLAVEEAEEEEFRQEAEIVAAAAAPAPAPGSRPSSGQPRPPQPDSRPSSGQPRPPQPQRTDSAEDRHQAALEELARRRQAQEAVNAQRRALETRRAHRTAYTKAWETLQHSINAYASATPFLPSQALPLTFTSFPWPAFTPISRPADLNRHTVLDFVYDGEVDEGRRRERVRNALKTWSPAGDKFASRVLRNVEVASRDDVLEGHAMVVRILNGELAKLE
ncbi:hypothetical protein EXIGLDRAFT_722634 [Exidia glandulosa HHB12029]|uniref:Uncharacterized protein n=1 Tax=Exidia glandulosa HHB12029 TaxID=1314781 RepID=A0A165F7M9_EXIGL|nr:hypothetical protein EXIGLDRAFT_722634 [Exidia glandulosa HHB12029]